MQSSWSVWKCFWVDAPTSATRMETPRNMFGPEEASYSRNISDFSDETSENVLKDILSR